MKELESALAALQPARAPQARDMLFFRAGRTQARRRALVWPGVSAVLLACLIVSLALRPAAVRPSERIVYLPAPAQAVQPGVPIKLEPLSPQDAELARRQGAYFKLRKALLEKGLDALPAASATGGAGGKSTRLCDWDLGDMDNDLSF